MGIHFEAFVNCKPKRVQIWGKDINRIQQLEKFFENKNFAQHLAGTQNMTNGDNFKDFPEAS